MKFDLIRFFSTLFLYNESHCVHCSFEFVVDMSKIKSGILEQVFASKSTPVTLSCTHGTTSI